MAQINVMVAGAAGRMGREIVKAITAASDMRVVGAVDISGVGADAGVLAGIGPAGVMVEPDLRASLELRTPDVLCDFTQPDVVMPGLRAALERRIACVVGTTGLTAENIEELRKLTSKAHTPVFIAANYAIGAVLMMRFAHEAARYFEYAEIVESHHEKKLDAPSGTALRTARLMKEAARGRLLDEPQSMEGEDSRGKSLGNIRIHAVRMPGYVASQDVIFGAPGETLTISHNTINRECFMPGVLLAIRKVRSLRGVVMGLDALL
jgi:4-hydroxy-tetrahydrodipicolinate reductase